MRRRRRRGFDGVLQIVVACADATLMSGNPFNEYLAGQRSTAHTARMQAIEDATKPIRKEDLPPDPHERIADLLLSLNAMWSMLEERGVTREQVHARIAQIQAEQEQHHAAPVRCTQCDSVIGEGRSSCQFCGHPAS